MKMSWVHIEIVSIFITGPSRVKLVRTAWQQLMTLALLGAAKSFRQVTPPYHWQLGSALPQLLMYSAKLM